MVENELYLDVLAGKRPDGSNIYVRDLLSEVDALRAEVEQVRGAWKEEQDAWVSKRDRLNSQLEASRVRESTARDAALEEVEAVCDALCRKLQRSGPAAACADAIRALKAQPARRYLDAEEVLEAMLSVADLDDSNTRTLLTTIAARLGLDLDAAPAAPASEAGARPFRECATCDSPNECWGWGTCGKPAPPEKHPAAGVATEAGKATCPRCGYFIEARGTYALVPEHEVEGRKP